MDSRFFVFPLGLFPHAPCSKNRWPSGLETAGTLLFSLKFSSAVTQLLTVIF